MAERNRRYYARFPQDHDAGAWRSCGASKPRTCGCPSGDRLTARRLRTQGNKLGMSDGPESLHYVLELPIRLTRVPARRGRRPRDRAQPDLRAPARGLLRGRRRHQLVGGAHASGGVRRAPGVVQRRAHPAVGVRGLRRARRRPRCGERAGRSTTGRGSMTRTCCAPTPCRSRPRSTPRTSTSSARFSEETAALVPGMRAWVTSEYDHNGLRADGERILVRLIDLARGRA